MSREHVGRHGRVGRTRRKQDHVRSPRVAALLALLAGAAACGKGDAPAGAGKASAAEAGGCGVAEGTVAAWLTTARLGADLGDSPSRTRKTAAEVNAALVGLAGFAAWCAAEPRRLPETCFAASSAETLACKETLAELGDLRVTGQACAAELRDDGVVWLAEAELGPRPEGDAVAAYDAKVAALRGRLAAAPFDEICADVGGLPLACLGAAQHKTCALIVDRLRGALTPAEPATDGATVPPPTGDAGAT